MTNSSTLEESCLAPSASGAPGFRQPIGRDPSRPCVQTGARTPRGVLPPSRAGCAASQLMAPSCFRCSLGLHFDAPRDCRRDGAGHTQCRRHKAARCEFENSRICHLSKSSFVGHGLRHGDTGEDPAAGVNIAEPAFRKLTDEKQEPRCNSNSQTTGRTWKCKSDQEFGGRNKMWVSRVISGPSVLSHEKAAPRTGQSVSLVKINIHRGLARLTEMAQQEAPPEFPGTTTNVPS
jgi:hypothetical protein